MCVVLHGSAFARSAGIGGSRACYHGAMGQCHSCGVELPRDVPIFRETECPNCSRPLKVCLNCAFYERGAQWDCRETIAEPVRDKDRANFCDYFRLRAGPRGNGAADAEQRRAKRARTDFDKLFG